jgi:hypothetical protein
VNALLNNLGVYAQACLCRLHVRDSVWKEPFYLKVGDNAEAFLKLGITLKRFLKLGGLRYFVD